MHNLHLAVVKAQNAKEACDFVESEISEWGNENNWRSICGAVSEANEVFINDKDGRYLPGENETIESINAMIKEWFNDGTYTLAIKEKIANGETDFTKWNEHELWLLKMCAEQLHELCTISKDDFSVLENTYYAFQFDQLGVTNMVNDEEEGKLFVVFIDMHS